MSLDLHLLGRFALFENGRELPVPGTKDRALLAFLAMRSGEPQSRERLTGLLWGDRPQEQARQSLRQSLSRLRRIAPLCFADRMNAWTSADLSSDAALFLSLAKSNRLSDLRRAAELHEETLMTGFNLGEPDFDDWLLSERARLAEMALAAIDRLIDDADSTLESSEIVFFARRALMLNPYRESAHRCLMHALARQGLRTEALQHYHELARRLKDDLDVDPDALTRKIYEAVRAGLIGPSTNIPPSDTPRGPAPARSGRAAGPRIAVLPLANVCRDPSVEYLCSGLAAGIADALAKFHSVQVIPPTSTMRFLQVEDRLTPLKQEARASYVLEGSLMTYNNHARLELRLIDVDEGLALWSERRECSRSNLLDLETSLTARLVATIEDRITQTYFERVRHSDQGSGEAYDCWLRGQHLLLQWKADVGSEAMKWFESALQKDARFARAHSSIALYLNGEILVAPGRPNDEADRKKALEHAKLAVECDPSDPRSHLSLGWVSFFLCDLARAKRSFLVAEQLNPNSADVLIHGALAAAYLGDASRGLDLAERALELNPLHPDWYYYFAAQIQVLAGEYDKAYEIGHPFVQDIPELGGWMAAALAIAGRHLEAKQTARKFVETVRAAWVGSQPMREQDAVEWFFSVNRWLHDRDRDTLARGLAVAGLLVVANSPEV